MAIPSMPITPMTVPFVWAVTVFYGLLGRGLGMPDPESTPRFLPRYLAMPNLGVNTLTKVSVYLADQVRLHDKYN